MITHRIVDANGGFIEVATTRDGVGVTIEVKTTTEHENYGNYIHNSLSTMKSRRSSNSSFLAK